MDGAYKKALDQWWGGGINASHLHGNDEMKIVDLFSALIRRQIYAESGDEIFNYWMKLGKSQDDVMQAGEFMRTAYDVLRLEHDGNRERWFEDSQVDDLL